MLDLNGEVAVTYDALSRFIARVEKHSRRELDQLMVHLEEDHFLLMDNEVSDLIDLNEAAIAFVEKRREELK